ncbi:MAG TPA: DnaJ domain-containing protein [Beijerinckiaceae bacterium]|jgi:hypothetical protein|nr:DnaJ domain-containing protein [Beijerinckiaceae bacterium]
MNLPFVFIVLAGILGGLWLLRSFANAKPAEIKKTVKQVGGIGSLAIAAFLIMRGRWDVGVAVGGVGLWLMGWAQAPDWAKNIGRSGKTAEQSTSQTSNVTSATIAMQLDHDTGAIDGSVIAGPYAGRRLADLSRGDAEALFRLCLQSDPDGARLLEAYFDRRFPGWRDAIHADGNRSTGGVRPAAMTEDEAYEVLGLQKGASAEDISRAHRNLMKKLHPDQGGTTSLAARVNEAKDVLVRRHTQTP